MIHGKNHIGFTLSAQGKEYTSSISPIDGHALEGKFHLATDTEVEKAIALATKAFKTYQNISGEKRALFLEAIADGIEQLGDTLIRRTIEETALPEGRIKGEMGRTTGQLRMFARLIKEGSWVEAIIDTALPNRKPLPRPDIRKVLKPVGLVVVFTASNFPLAFSTAGGDTASALASGCPVIVKAHESHLGTNQLIADAIIKAAKQTHMPDGVFSSLTGKGHQPGQKLLGHPSVKSVAFTGSFTGGKALMDIAAKRDEPIPVFAEMGSVNPVLLCQDKLKSEPGQLAKILANSITLGCGQFCTKPGLLLAVESPELEKFSEELATAIQAYPATTMLNQGIWKNYSVKRNESLSVKGVNAIEPPVTNDTNQPLGHPVIAMVNGLDFLKNPKLQEEVFGPFSLIIRCQNMQELSEVAKSLKGQLAASVMGTENDLPAYKNVITELQQKVGRLIFNAAPTGVEVGHAMQHGGPFPSSSDSRFTSVGTSAVKRFVRPVAFQDMPELLLPEELKNANPLKILRQVNGEITRDRI